MRKLIVTLTALFIITGCNENDTSLDSIVRNAEANAEEREIAKFAAYCDAPENDPEIALTFNAIKTATASADCAELGKNALTLQELDLSNTSISNLTPLLEIENLSVLNISGNRISDLSVLSGITGLTSLDISNNSIEDLTPIAGLVTLASLNAENNAIQDVVALAGLFNLIALNLENNQISNIAPLDLLVRIADFKMNGNTLGTSLSKDSSNCPLAETSSPAVKSWCQERNQVKTFIEYCNNYENESAAIQLTIDRLKGFKSCAEAEAEISQLVELDLSVERDADTYAPLNPELRLTDLSPISSFTNLEILVLNNNLVTDVEPISHLVNLKSLAMQGNGVVDIGPLSYLTKLLALDLAINKVVDISAVRNMDALTALVLNLNEVVDISPIENLPLLSGIGLEYNQVVDPSPLAALPGLLVLDLSFNQVSDFSSFQNLTVLTQFDYECNTLGTTLGHSEATCPTTGVSGYYSVTCNALKDLPDADAVADADPTNDRASLTAAYCPASGAAREGIRTVLHTN
ncbi:MAG: leucine-rich repeat domain-containing protein [Pseudobacteriovorax sp.]|nr:leucine-rich repeat domain-containing protein [Pseudobacteriovorax sp.]